MKRLLILGVLVLAPNAADAKPPAFQCPGENTVEMRYCAEKSWAQSDAQLRQKVGKQLMEQWQQAAKELCSAAYAPDKDGTIYLQLVVGCDDRLGGAGEESLGEGWEDLGNGLGGYGSDCGMEG